MPSKTFQQFLQDQGVDSSTIPQAQQQTPSDESMLGTGLGTLGNLYLQGQTVNNLQSSQNNLNQQIGSLQDMYNPNGVVAQQMSQSLAAKDAAAGRNSQYGARSAALQAALAQGASRNASTIGSLQDQVNKNNLQQQNSYAQTLGSLFNLSNKTGFSQYAQNGLGNLWSQYGPQSNPGQGIAAPSSGSMSPGGDFGMQPQTSNYSGGFNAQQPSDGSLGSGTYGMQQSNNPTPSQSFGSGAGTNFLGADSLSGDSGSWNSGSSNLFPQ